jgi:phytoene synthase
MRCCGPRISSDLRALHRFASLADDVGDGRASPAAKHAAIAAWRRDVAACAPEDPTTAALMDAIRRHDLPITEIEALLQGLESDIDRTGEAPDRAALALYCRRVAGSIGVLVMGILGRTSAADHRYALALGEALQLINIARDIDADAGVGRVYVPRETLIRNGFSPLGDGTALAESLSLNAIRQDLFAEIDHAFARVDSLRANPPLVVRLIAGAYRRLFDRLRMSDGPGVRLRWHDKVASAFAALLRA